MYLMLQVIFSRKEDGGYEIFGQLFGNRATIQYSSSGDCGSRYGECESLSMLNRTCNEQKLQLVTVERFSDVAMENVRLRSGEKADIRQIARNFYLKEAE